MLITEEITLVYYKILWLKKISPLVQKGFPVSEDSWSVLFSNGPEPTASFPNTNFTVSFPTIRSSSHKEK